MGNLMWKLRQLFSQLMPLVMIGGLVYGGYHLATQGYFGRNVSRTVYKITRPLKRLPVFGTLFRGGHRSNVARGRHHRRHRGTRHHRRYRRRY